MSVEVSGTATGPIALSPVESAVFARIAARILPLLILAYLFNFVDRTNIAVAALEMNRDIALTAGQFGYGAGILFLGYCLFEVPSNLALYRFGARSWIARIMVTWGLVSAAMVFVSGPVSFYALRFLLGVAEAGFFPGVAFYLSNWFPPAYRARIIGWFLVAIPASSLIGAPLSGLLMELDGLAGLHGWQWLFLVESLPCVALGGVIWRCLPDTLEEAPWLSEVDMSVARACLLREVRVSPISKLSAVFTDKRVWILSGIYLGFSIGSYGTQVWLPLIIKQERFSDLAVAFLTAVPYLFSVVAMILWASLVDRHGRRVDNVVATCLLAAAGFVVALVSQSFAIALAGLTVALVGVNAARAVFWAIPPRFLTGVAAAGGLALINSVGTLGGFLGPAIMGWLKDATGSFTPGLFAMAGFLAAAAGLASTLRRLVRSD